MSTRVFVLSPSLVQSNALTVLIDRAGFDAASIFQLPEGKIREIDPNRLSSEQMGELSQDILAEIEFADIVVVKSNRQMYPSQSFHVGAAYALGKPVVVVGPYDEIGYYSPRIVSADAESLIPTLKKLEKARVLATTAQHNSTRPAGRGDLGGDGRGGEAGDGSHI